jgi:hypothetical protein
MKGGAIVCCQFGHTEELLDAVNAKRIVNKMMSRIFRFTLTRTLPPEGESIPREPAFILAGQMTLDAKGITLRRRLLPSNKSIHSGNRVSEIGIAAIRCPVGKGHLARPRRDIQRIPHGIQILFESCLVVASGQSTPRRKLFL